MRISDWSSDVCSSDLRFRNRAGHNDLAHPAEPEIVDGESGRLRSGQRQLHAGDLRQAIVGHQPQELDPEAHVRHRAQDVARTVERADAGRSEEHTSELQSLMRISYAVFCLKKKKHTKYYQQLHHSIKIRSLHLTHHLQYYRHRSL